MLYASNFQFNNVTTGSQRGWNQTGSGLTYTFGCTGSGTTCLYHFDHIKFPTMGGTGTQVGDTSSGVSTVFDDGGNTGLTAAQVSIGGTVHQKIQGTCTFAASLTCAVTFVPGFGATTPAFFIPPNITGTATTLTVSALSATGATITASASNSAAVGWMAMIQ